MLQLAGMNIIPVRNGSLSKLDNKLSILRGNHVVSRCRYTFFGCNYFTGENVFKYYDNKTGVDKTINVAPLESYFEMGKNLG